MLAFTIVIIMLNLLSIVSLSHDISDLLQCTPPIIWRKLNEILPHPLDKPHLFPLMMVDIQQIYVQ